MNRKRHYGFKNVTKHFRTYRNDKKFYIYWETSRKESMPKYVLIHGCFAAFLMELIGCFYYFNNISMFGYEQDKTMIVAALFGFALGSLIAVLQWNFHNHRFDNLKAEEHIK